MRRTQRSAIGALISDYRLFAGRRLWLSLVLMQLGALAEGCSLLILVPLAALSLNASDPHVARWPGFARNPEDRLLIASALFVLAMAARSSLLLARDLLQGRLEADYQASLRLRSAATLAARGWSFAGSIGQSGIQSLLLNDVPRATEAVSSLQQFAAGSVMLTAQLAVALFLSPALTLIAVLCVLVGCLITFKSRRRWVASGSAIIETLEDSTSSGFRLHAGLKAALAQGTVGPFLDEYRSALSRNSGEMARFARDYSRAQQQAFAGAALVATLLILMGVRVLALPFPLLVASLVAYARISGPAQLVQSSAIRAAAYSPAFSSICDRLGSLHQQVPERSVQDPIDWQELTLNEIRCEHGPGLGVRAATLRLRRGEWLGIRGASGSGKTTLIDVVAGLMEPQAGIIAVDGKALEKELLDRWRAGIAYLGQDPTIFSDTVRANLVLGGDAVDDDELFRVLEIAGLAQRVRDFPSGLDESVGDRGSQLSGGERGRLAIARSLLRRPTLLILDEATAALDLAAETDLITRLKAIEPRAAALLVTHRNSTLKQCDAIVSVEHGWVECSH